MQDLVNADNQINNLHNLEKYHERIQSDSMCDLEEDCFINLSAQIKDADYNFEDDFLSLDD